MLSMFEQLFENRLVGAIGAKVVDERKDFTISVHVPPPPEEGRAVITNIEVPSEFTPNVSFAIKATMRNDGGDDKLFTRLINRDTGNVLRELISPIISKTGTSWIFTIRITLTQTTDFHGRLEVGHIT